MSLDDDLRTVSEVAALPAGKVCACCGVALPPECATLPWRCPRCEAHSCAPFQGIMRCLGVTDDLGDRSAPGPGAGHRIDERRARPDLPD